MSASFCKHNVLLGFHCNYCEREQQAEIANVKPSDFGTKENFITKYALPFDLGKVVKNAVKSVESRPDYVLRPKHAQHRFYVVQWRFKTLNARWRFMLDTVAFGEYRLSYIAGETTMELDSCDFLKTFTFSEAVKFVESMKAIPENDGKEWIICGFVEVWR